MTDGVCGWWILPWSNRQPCGYEPRALPVELMIRIAAGYWALPPRELELGRGRFERPSDEGERKQTPSRYLPTHVSPAELHRASQLGRAASYGLQLSCKEEDYLRR